MRDRFLAWLARGVLARPAAILGTALAMTIVAATLVPGLRVEAGHSSIFDPRDKHQRRFKAFLSRFGSPNVLFVLASGGTRAGRHAVVDALRAKLPAPPSVTRSGSGASSTTCDPRGAANHPGCVRSVLARVDMKALERYGLLYAPLRDLKQLVAQLADKKLGLDQLLALRDLPDLIKLVAAEVERRAAGQAPTGKAAEQAKQAMAMATRVIDELRLRVEQAARAKLPIEQALAPPGTLDAVRRGVDAQGYFASRDGKIAIAMVRPRSDSDEPDILAPFVEYVRRFADAAVADVNKRFASSKAGPIKVVLTGLPALVADERQALSRDVPLTSTVAAVGILLLFVFAFRSVRQGVLAMVALGCALLCALAITRFAVGGLNLVTSAAIPTVLGLGIDFSVHLLARYNEARHGGADAREGVKLSILGAGPGILTGALTTAGAFAALIINRFKGFAELGLITAIGLGLSLIATLTVTAAALSWKRTRWLQVPPKARPPRDDGLTFGIRLARMVERRRWVVIGVGLLLSAALLFEARKTPWSYNYIALLPQDRPAVKGIVTLAERSDFSGEVAALEATSLAEARRLVAALVKKPSVGRVESIISFLPEGQQAKRALLATLSPRIHTPAWQRATSQPSTSQPSTSQPSTPSSQPSARAAGFDLTRFDSALESLADNLQDARFSATRANQHAQAKLLAGPIAALAKLRAAIKKDHGAARARLALLQRELLRKADRGYELLVANVRGPQLTATTLLSSLPAGIRERLVTRGKDGKLHYALYIHPKTSVWRGNMLEHFVADVRSVKGDATGFTVIHWEANVLIRSGFRDASIIAVALLMLLLLIDFRRPLFAAFAAAPLALGIAWMLGAMALADQTYNFANVIAFPLIVGIGVASGVHILHRYRQDGEGDIAPVVRHTGLAIFLSAATTMVGFGSVALSSHRGASSLGLLLLLGVGACLVTSTMFLPAMLAVRKARRERREGRQK
ncbi:MAG: MMPL family transporter [Myxococcales bacterium]|nr:MMPL family transporter [Myxococcales bacterium]